MTDMWHEAPRSELVYEIRRLTERLAAVEPDADRWQWFRDQPDVTFDPETGETFVRFDPLLFLNGWFGAKNERAVDLLADVEMAK